MANTEDYLDSLLSSISDAKDEVRDAAERDRRRKESEIRQRNRIGSDDDFMRKTGIDSYTPRRTSYDNLREAFSESDFLREFESELDNGDADSYIRDFERELSFSVEEDERRSYSDDDRFVDDETFDSDDNIDGFLDEDGDDLENSFDDDDNDDKDKDDGFGSGFDESLKEDIEERIEEAFLKNDGEVAPPEIMGEILDASKISDDIDSDDLSLDDLEALALAVGDDVGADIAGEAPKRDEKTDTIQTENEIKPDDIESSDASKEEAETSFDENIESEPDLSNENPSENAEDELNLESIDDLLDLAAEKMSDSESVEGINSDIESLGGLSEEHKEPEDDFLQPEFKPDELDNEDNLNQDEIERLLNGEETSDEDILSILGDEDPDLKNLLDADENDLELSESRDAFEASADGVSLDSIDESADENEGGKEKGNFISNIISKIKGLFSGGGEEDDVVSIVENAPPMDLSDENAAILKNFDEADKKEDKKQKKAKKAEDKEAKKKEKEAKKKEGDAEKEKAKKAKDEAKRRKAEEKARKAAAKPKDNSPKINPKQLLPFLVLAASLIILVLVAMRVINENTSVSQAERAYENGDYITAYEKIGNMEFKSEEDLEFKRKTHILAELQKKYQSYQILFRIKKYDMALDELVNGYGRYLFNYEEAKSLGISDKYDAIAKLITDQLMDEFGITTERAEELYNTHDRKKYTIELILILESHGLEVKY